LAELLVANTLQEEELVEVFLLELVDVVDWGKVDVVAFAVPAATPIDLSPPPSFPSSTPPRAPPRCHARN
jgi:hypothetical protein